MKAMIRLDVPDYQIGQPVSVYFKDTMEKHGLLCEKERGIVRCKDCKHAEILSWLDNAIICKRHSYCGVRPDDFFCADGES